MEELTLRHVQNRLSSRGGESNVKNKTGWFNPANAGVMKDGASRGGKTAGDNNVKNNKGWFDPANAGGGAQNKGKRLGDGIQSGVIDKNGKRSLSDTEIVKEVIGTVDLDILEDIVSNSKLAMFIRLLNDRGIKFGRHRWYDKDDVPGVRSLLSDDIAISKEVLRLEQSNKF